MLAGQLWLELGALAALAVASSSPLLGRPLVTTALAHSTSHPDVTLGSFAGLVVCYGVLGFGYILPATFLPVLAREVVDNPQLFGLAWPIFGVAAALSTIATARHFGHVNRLPSGPSAVLMAAGVVLPSVWLAPVTVAIAALLVAAPSWS